jgi:hypothetical protein
MMRIVLEFDVEIYCSMSSMWTLIARKWPLLYL